MRFRFLSCVMLLCLAVPVFAQNVSVGVVSADLVTALDSKKAKVGQEVTFTTRRTALLESGATLPKGTVLVGKVMAAVPSAKGTDGSVTISIEAAKLKDGSTVALTGTVRGVAPVPPDADTAASMKGGLNMNSEDTNAVVVSKTTVGEGSTVPGVALEAGVLTAKGKNLKLDEGTIFLIGIAAK